MAEGGAATAIAAGAQAPARTGAGAVVGGVAAEGGATGTVIADTAEAAPGAAIKVETEGVTVITVENTGDVATAGTGATPDDNNLINLISLLMDLFPLSGFTTKVQLVSQEEFLSILNPKSKKEHFRFVGLKLLTTVDLSKYTIDMYIY